MTSLPLRLVALALVSLLAGCATSRLGLDYEPTPAELVLHGPDENSEPLARVLVSVVEARRTGKDGKGPWELLVRMRLENLAATSVRLLPDELLLVDGELNAFGSVVLTDLPQPLVRGEASQFELLFPLPGGTEPKDLDLDGLNLRCPLEIDGKRLVLGASFTRVRDDRDSRVQIGYGYRYGYGYGSWHPGVGWWW